MRNSELISLLEKEMRKDIENIDIPASEEDKININNIKEWYCEAEKVTRVLANILGAPMNQAINQLRYAGHHVLKAQTTTDEAVAQSNLIEAFKHCKRAVYDALDFYVYEINEKYRVLMPQLDSLNAIQLEGLLKEHISDIHTARSSNQDRVGYYKGVQGGLIKGLNLIEEINKVQRKTGVAKALHINKQSMLYENHRLQDHVHTLQIKNEELEGKLGGKFSRFSIILAILLGFCVPFGIIVANAYITTTHEVTVKTAPYSDEASIP